MSANNENKSGNNVDSANKNINNKNSNRYICFNLGAQEYGVPLLSIKEVLGLPEVTPIPQCPNYFLGIMNLRGKVVSVMDLRTKNCQCQSNRYFNQWVEQCRIIIVLM